jgi:hypothetical protein
MYVRDMKGVSKGSGTIPFWHFDPYDYKGSVNKVDLV